MTKPLSVSFPPVKKLHNSRQPFRGRNVGPTLQYTHLNIASGDDEKSFTQNTLNSTGGAPLSTIQPKYIVQRNDTQGRLHSRVPQQPLAQFDQDFMYNFIEMSLPSLFKIAAISFRDSTTGRTTLKVPLRKTHTLDASIN